MYLVAPVLVLQRQVGDRLRNHWPRARRRHCDSKIGFVVPGQRLERSNLSLQYLVLALYITKRYILRMKSTPLREQSYLILLALAPDPLYGYGIIAAVR